MKLSKSARTRLKNRLKKGTLVCDVQEDGRVFYFETEAHKTKIKNRKHKG